MVLWYNFVSSENLAIDFTTRDSQSVEINFTDRPVSFSQLNKGAPPKNLLPLEKALYIGHIIFPPMSWIAHVR